MATIKLTGLQANNPLAVMAAYGVLRLLPEATLAWSDAHPELVCDGDPVKRLADLVSQRRQAPEVMLFDRPESISDYRLAAEQMPTDWLIAFAAESDVDADKTLATDLKLLGGRHQFVRNARDVMDALISRGAAARIRNALVGPWHYEEGPQAWGWDAAANIDTAASSKPGTDTPKYVALGAGWLAWESLPLWPMVNGRTLQWERGLRYVTVGQRVGWHELLALMLGALSLGERERHALSIEEWFAPQLATSKFGSVLGWARKPARTLSSAR